VPEAYGTLAEVYEFLVPEPLLDPAGSVAAFDMALGDLRPGARVLDCACGTGQLAVGLALRGFAASASDASAAMVERTTELRAAGPAPAPATSTYDPAVERYLVTARRA